MSVQVQAGVRASVDKLLRGVRGRIVRRVVRSSAQSSLHSKRLGLILPCPHDVLTTLNGLKGGLVKMTSFLFCSARVLEPEQKMNLSLRHDSP